MKGSRMKAPAADGMGLLDYIDTASDRGVFNIEFQRWNQAANIRIRANEALAELLKEWIKVEAEAMYCAWQAERRKRLLEAQKAGQLHGGIEAV